MPRSRATLERQLLERLDEAADRLVFLSEVSRVLSSALTDKECFNHLLSLVVPKMGDWGTLNIVDEKGEIKRVAVSAADPKKQALLETALNSIPPRLKDITGPGYVIAHGKSELVTDSQFAKEQLLKELGHPEWTEGLKILGIRSRLAVPLMAHRKILGALWMASAESGRVFTRRDLRIAEEIASRAAYSVYHLMRYSHTFRNLHRLEIEMEVREQFLTQLRHDALSVLTGAQLSAQMIQRTKDPEKKNEFARRIVSTVQRVTEIVRTGKKAEPTQLAKKAG